MTCFDIEMRNNLSGRANTVEIFTTIIIRHQIIIVYIYFALLSTVKNENMLMICWVTIDDPDIITWVKLVVSMFYQALFFSNKNVMLSIILMNQITSENGRLRIVARKTQAGEIGYWIKYVHDKTKLWKINQAHSFFLINSTCLGAISGSIRPWLFR